jgi:hypothetical protein
MLYYYLIKVIYSHFKNIIFDINYDQNKSIYQLQQSLKNKLLKEFSNNDFEFKKIIYWGHCFRKIKV